MLPRYKRKVAFEANEFIFASVSKMASEFLSLKPVLNKKNGVFKSSLLTHTNEKIEGMA